MKKIILVLPALLLLLSSCTERKNNVVHLLFDKSTSVSDLFIREAYKQDAAKITGKLREGDVIVINTITANSLATYSPVIIRVPDYDIFGNNSDIHRKIVDSVANSIRTETEKIISDAKEEQTDILNSVINAIRHLHSSEFSEYKKTIVIFSDMEQITEELDLTEYKPDDKSVLKIINNLSTEGKLPDMTGVRVIIAGAGFSNSGNNSFGIAKTQFLRSFWMSFFRNCNAEISESDYGARYTGGIAAD